jgi:hypothetical protein
MAPALKNSSGLSMRQGQRSIRLAFNQHHWGARVNFIASEELLIRLSDDLPDNIDD